MERTASSFSRQGMQGHALPHYGCVECNIGTEHVLQEGVGCLPVVGACVLAQHGKQVLRKVFWHLHCSHS